VAGGMGLFVFVWFSDDSRLAVFFRLVFVVIVHVIIVVGVSRRHRVNEYCT
jgi:hypothetical protein